MVYLEMLLASSNGNIFRIADRKWGKFTSHRWFTTPLPPPQTPITRGFELFFDLRLKKRLSKQSKRRYLRRHRAHYDVTAMGTYVVTLFSMRNSFIQKIITAPFGFNYLAACPRLDHTITRKCITVHISVYITKILAQLGVCVLTHYDRDKIDAILRTFSNFTGSYQSTFCQCLLSEPMMISSLTHICVTQPRWVIGYAFVIIPRMKIVPQKKYDHCWEQVWLK